MIITIGKSTEKYMKVLGIVEYPFYESQLKTAFRNRSKETHPDVTGNPETAKEFTKVTEAFEALQNLALSEDEMTPKVSVEAARMQNEISKDIFRSKLFNTCSHCKGTGQVTMTFDKMVCPKCSPKDLYSRLFNISGLGYFEKPCRSCKATGQYEQLNGRIVPCRTCGGTGIFKLQCLTCKGAGVLYAGETKILTCHHCNGVGKIEVHPFNPVIPVGAVLR